MAVLSRSEILDVVTLETEAVTVPEWGGEVLVRALTLGQHLALQEKSTGDYAHDAALLLIASVVDGGGNPILNPDDADALCKSRASAANTVLEVAFRLNRATKDDADALKKI